MQPRGLMELWESPYSLRSTGVSQLYIISSLFCRKERDDKYGIASHRHLGFSYFLMFDFKNCLHLALLSMHYIH